MELTANLQAATKFPVKEFGANFAAIEFEIRLVIKNSSISVICATTAGAFIKLQYKYVMEMAYPEIVIDFRSSSVLAQVDKWCHY